MLIRLSNFKQPSFRHKTYQLLYFYVLLTVYPCKKKVIQSHYRPAVAQSVPGS